MFTFKVTDDSLLIPVADPNVTYTDVMYYYKNKNNYCSLASTALENGIACAYYALNDKCPWDSSKGYWECLPKF